MERGDGMTKSEAAVSAPDVFISYAREDEATLAADPAGGAPAGRGGAAPARVPRSPQKTRNGAARRGTLLPQRPAEISDP